MYMKMKIDIFGISLKIWKKTTKTYKKAAYDRLCHIFTFLSRKKKQKGFILSVLILY